MTGMLTPEKWQARIIAECVRRLGRELTAAEERFIRSRGSFIALEMIDDTVRDMDEAALRAYLNSEKE